MAKTKTTEIPVVKKPYRTLPVNGMNDLVTMGEMIARTKLFGTINPAEGYLLATISYQTDTPINELSQIYNMVHGRLTKKPDAMLADLLLLGGDYKILERTKDSAKIEFTCGDRSYISEVDFEKLKHEPVIYDGKEGDIAKLINAGQFNKLSIKPKYSTERARMQMIWARCVSDGVRVVCPGACKGIYTPEEASDFDEETTAPCAPPAPLHSFNPPEVTPSVSPVEICPIGQFEGKKWEELETDILVMVEDLNDPAITAEMKQHVRDILAARKGSN